VVSREFEGTQSAWRLVWIAALVSSAAAVPVMWYLAPLAGAVAALAAMVMGVPVVAFARRWQLRRAWQAAGLGLFAAVSAAAVAGLVLGSVAFTGDDVTPRGYVGNQVWQFATIAAPFGPAAAMVYWSRYVAAGWASRHSTAIAIGSICLTAIIFSANHEIR
jgi:hypothetical protein